MNIQFDSELDTIVNIKVLGVGGGGGNAVEYMINSGIQGVEYICVNTDAHVLRNSKANQTVQIGEKLTRGRGAGNKPEIGRQSAEESREEIANVLKGTQMVFITAGMGGGTGTGAAPVVAQIAQEMGILTVGVVTKPFNFEREQKMKQAEAGIAELSKYVDSLVVIPNEKLLVGLDKPLTMKESFARSDAILYDSVKSISDLVTSLGTVNLDFADVCTVMRNAGVAHMAVGQATGKNKAEEVANQVISSPILETTLAGAGKMLIYITMSEDVLADEIDMFTKLITEAAKPDVETLQGFIYDEDATDTLKATVIATGFDGGKNDLFTTAEETSASEDDDNYDTIMSLFTDK